MLFLILTIGIGTLGGLLARQMKVPAPFMIGSMVTVAIVSMTTGKMESSNLMKLFAQMVSGSYIGQTISKDDLLNLPKIGKSIVGLMALFTLNMLVLGLIFIYVFHMDPVTALLSCLPGGIMDVSLMAIDMGAQADVVATLQSARLIGILILLPIWVNFWVTGLGQAGPSKDDTVSTPSTTSSSTLSRQSQGFNNIVVLLVSAIGGSIGYWLGVPVGTLIFSLIFSSLLKITCKTSQLSKSIRFTAQVFAGSIIGTSFTQESLLRMLHLIFPIILLLSSYLIINILFGYVMYKRKVFDLQSALFASSPAGATDISLLAGDLGGDLAKIASIQISRTLYTVIIMPLLVKLILQLL
ncbi:AbrB family transcriptional regulator [Streptococcus plurextorum]|uniref:AbrB family transcriptional regulator n=1 Tax=Streptococcus plurextorum TaxID=456876 RepID=UPI000416F477|nr:AbrB family transcriptional regulator [Streptococcus plurextorum]